MRNLFVISDASVDPSGVSARPTGTVYGAPISTTTAQDPLRNFVVTGHV